MNSSRNNPVFSIITPTHNRPDMLRRNILSVIGQTYSDYEHIIIDDASHTDTQKVINEFNQSRIVFLKHDIHKGAASSYNTGIRNSRGRYITFLDDDDEFMPVFLEKMNNAFKIHDQNIGFVWSGISKVEDNDQGEELVSSLNWPTFFRKREDELVAATSIGNGYGLCVRKECIDNIGLYDETLKVCEDTDFLFRLTIKFSCLTIPEMLVKIHHHGSPQLTSDENFIERIEGREIVLERYSDLLQQYPKLFSVHYNAYADLCYRAGLKKKGRKAFFSIIKIDPLRILTYSDLVSFEITGKRTAITGPGKFFVFLISIMKGSHFGKKCN